MLQAWSADGPTTHYGKFYTYRFLNPWPRPYQKPYPPCYIVGSGSPETIELAAELGFGYSSVFVPQKTALGAQPNDCGSGPPSTDTPSDPNSSRS